MSINSCAARELGLIGMETEYSVVGLKRCAGYSVCSMLRRMMRSTGTQQLACAGPTIVYTEYGVSHTSLSRTSSVTGDVAQHKISDRGGLCILSSVLPCHPISFRHGILEETCAPSVLARRSHRRSIRGRDGPARRCSDHSSSYTEHYYTGCTGATTHTQNVRRLGLH